MSGPAVEPAASVAFRVFGDPIAKGSMVCMGQRGPVRHVLVDSKQKTLTPWSANVRAIAEKAAQEGDPGVWPTALPVVVSAVFSLPRPRTVTVRKRPWPTSHTSGDVDKLLRSVLDAITGVLIVDDSQVLSGHGVKAYVAPPGPLAADVMDRPGVVVRISILEGN